MIFTELRIAANKNNKINFIKKEIKKFKNIHDFIEWRQSMRIYMLTRKNTFNIENIHIIAWIKDETTGEIYEELFKINTKGQTTLESSRKIQYLKDKTWDDKEGWSKVTRQKELYENKQQNNQNYNRDNHNNWPHNIKTM